MNVCQCSMFIRLVFLFAVFVVVLVKKIHLDLPIDSNANGILGMGQINCHWTAAMDGSSYSVHFPFNFGSLDL